VGSSAWRRTELEGSCPNHADPFCFLILCMPGTFPASPRKDQIWAAAAADTLNSNTFSHYIRRYQTKTCPSLLRNAPALLTSWSHATRIYGWHPILFNNITQERVKPRPNLRSSCTHTYHQRRGGNTATSLFAACLLFLILCSRTSSAWDAFRPSLHSNLPSA